MLVGLPKGSLIYKLFLVVQSLYYFLNRVNYLGGISMKRFNNLYNDICKFENIVEAYNEVCRNTKNKRKVENLKEYKSIYISRIRKILEEKSYEVGPYNKFIVYEPKERQITSQGVQDKIINHLVARYILYPALLPCLLDVNVASRKNMGTSKGLEYAADFSNKCKIKYGEYYILKCDISKFFYSINHEILKQKLLCRIKDKDALKIVFDIIDSSNPGLYIGSMTSQILAIFYLNDMDHFIKEELKIKYYVRYQDDFLLFHHSKKYLRYCLEEIKNFLKKEKLELNAKTRIFKNTNNLLFLGRNSKGRYARYRNVKRKLKNRYFLYENNLIPLNSITSSFICYKGLCNKNNFTFMKK